MYLTAFITNYSDVIISVMASQITSLTIVYSTVNSRRRSKKTSKLHVTGLCVGNSPLTGEFLAQRTSNAENVSIWWCHHELLWYTDWRYPIPWQNYKHFCALTRDVLLKLQALWCTVKDIPQHYKHFDALITDILTKLPALGYSN